MKKTFKKILLPALALIMAVTVFSVAYPVRANAATASVAYVNASGTSMGTKTCTVIDSSSSYLSDGWYAVTGNVTFDGRMSVIGSNVNLILTDGHTLTVTNGIDLGEGDGLTIWAQTKGTGALEATASTNNPGIGPQNGGAVFGTLVINGGKIHASSPNQGAGIGGRTHAAVAYGSITINGGTVTAEGGYGAAGIGAGQTGSNYFEPTNNMTITINGGTVNATGGIYAAGIGGGDSRESGTIVINGGTVTATGGKGGGPGIGAGCPSIYVDSGSGNNITINGGTVTATGNYTDSFYDQGEAIGGSRTAKSQGTLKIKSGLVVQAGETAAQAQPCFNYAAHRGGYAKIWAHTHSLSYSASGNTLTCTCANSNCNMKNKKFTYTLTANNAEYDGAEHGAVPGSATLAHGTDDLNALTGLSISDSKVEYYKGSSTTKLSSVPVHAGSYTAKLKMTIGGTAYTLSKAYSITQKEVGLTWGSTSLVYTGSPRVPTLTLTGVVSGDECTPTVTGAQTNAGGPYTAKVTKLSNADYKLPSVTTQTFEITKKTRIYMNAPSNYSKTYTGEPLALVKAGEIYYGSAYTDIAPPMLYSTDGEHYSTDIPTAVDAGSYTVYYKVDGGQNFVSYDGGTVTATISKKNITNDLRFTLSQTSFVYDGTAKTPGVTVTDSEGNPVSEDLYSVAYYRNINVPTSSSNRPYVRIVSNSNLANHSFDKTINFTIEKADPTVTPPEAAVLHYTGGEQQLLSQGASSAHGTITYSLDGENYASGIPSATDIGEYTVYYRIKGDKNHTNAEYSISVRIRANIDELTGAIEDATEYYNEIKDDFEEIAQTLYEAIGAAQDVADVAETQESVDTAKTALDEALADAKEAVRLAVHIWDEGVIVKDATCTEMGDRLYTCTVEGCGKTETRTDVPIDPDNHVNTVDADETFSTCITHGYTAGKYCNDCETYFSGHVEKPYAEHTWSEVAKVKPTCSAEGYIDYACAVKSCTATRREVLDIDPDAHVLKTTVTPPTCLDDGFTTHACELCRYSYADNIVPALGHSYGEPVWTWDEEARTAVAAFTCTVCGDPLSKDGDISSAYHNPGCEKDGYTAYTAKATAGERTYISDPLVVIDEGSRTGHSYGEPTWKWESENKAVATFTCENCGAKKKITAAGDMITKEVIKEATIDEDGETLYTATVQFEGSTYMSDLTVITEFADKDKICPLCGQVHGEGMYNFLLGLVHLIIYLIRDIFGK